MIVRGLELFLVFCYSFCTHKSFSRDVTDFDPDTYESCGAAPYIKPGYAQPTGAQNWWMLKAERDKKFVPLRIIPYYVDDVKKNLKGQTKKMNQLQSSVNESIKFFESLLKVRSENTSRTLNISKCCRRYNYVKQIEGDQFVLYVDYGCKRACRHGKACKSKKTKTTATVAYATKCCIVGNQRDRWYDVNKSKIDDLYWYGKGKGCEFALQSCRSFLDHVDEKKLYRNQEVATLPYCSEEHVKNTVEAATKEKRKPLICSPDRSASLICRVNNKKKDKENCSHYNDVIWSDGGDSVCEHSESQPKATANAMAETFGSTSICVEQGSFFVTVACDNFWKMFGGTSRFKHYGGAGCYKHKCEDGRLQILAFSGQNEDSVNKHPYRVCWAKGAEIKIRRRITKNRFVTGTIKCPSCKEVCEGRGDNFKCADDVYGINPVDKLIPTCGGESTWAARLGPFLTILTSILLLIML